MKARHIVAAALLASLLTTAVNHGTGTSWAQPGPEPSTDYRTITLTTEQSSQVARGHDAYDEQFISQVGANLHANYVVFSGSWELAKQELSNIDAEIEMIENTPSRDPPHAVEKAARLEELRKARRGVFATERTWAMHSVRSGRIWEMWQENVGGGD